MSSYNELINHLSKTNRFPVEIKEIVSWLEANGFQDEIHFYPVDVDEDTASAWIVRKKEVGKPYSEAKRISNIYYSSRHNECWARFYVCKELMHLFDHENTCAADDEEKVGSLIAELIDWNKYSDSVRSPQAKADVMAYSRALLCLAPAHAIDAIIEGGGAESLTQNEIALFLKIPEIWVEVVFKERYLKTHSSVKHGLNLVR